MNSRSQIVFTELIKKETSMYKMLLVIITILLFVQTIAAQKNDDNKRHIGLSDFLAAFYDISSLPSYAAGTYSAEVSTYDRTGLNNDGFAGTYSFIRRNADSSLVIFDIKGTGLINRIWTPTPSDDSLDFYIDDTLTPSFTICYRDLFSGKVYPFTTPLCANQLGGYYCYLPIPFSESCKIIFRGKKTRFHQIGYRLYPEGTHIKKFMLPLNKEEEQALTKIKTIWDRASFSVKDLNKEGLTISAIDKNASLFPGQKLTVFETNQSGRILGFELSSDDGLKRMAKYIDLKITWDDEGTPAVFCPLADYFGYAFSKPSMKSLLIGSDAEKNYSYFPMPFDKSAKIELLYTKPTDGTKETGVHFQCRVFYTGEKRNVAKEGKFYAYWNRDNPVPIHQPYVMLDIKGKGHFVGTVLQAQGLKPGMTLFFEGDDSTVADGELRMHGTGSEDFFNGGWYALLDRWDAAMSLPLSGALEYSLPLCRTGGYRLFVTDKVSFERSFFQSIEHGPEHNMIPSDYTSVSYYYCSRPNIQKLIPSPENIKLYIPDTLILYPQLLNTGIEGYATTETKWTFPTGGLTFYYTIKENTIIRMSLHDIPPGNYRMYLDYVKSPGSARFSIWQRQTQLTDWIDGHDANVDRVEMQRMSDVVITPLNNTVSFRFKTNSGQDQFILNRIILVKNR
jgi:D-arabinan exo alpha-(1,3)/(1,5)-arabinofuranosidase (non-reducing end)